MPSTARRPAITWRTMLFVPATSDRFIESAIKQPADALVIDLEDGVPLSLKTEGRARASGIADRFQSAGFGVVIRVNRLWRLLVRDLEACVRESVQALALPKVPDASFVCAVSEIISELEAEAGMQIGHTKLIIGIEDAEGLENMQDIARSDPRMYGMFVGAEDLAHNLHMAVDSDTLYVPNVLAVSACRRAGILPLGHVGSVADYADREAYRHSVERGARLGFEGTFCIHPSQLDIANAAYTPHADAVVRAQRLVDEFNASLAQGRATCTFEGRMVDAPVVLQARQLIARFNEIQDMRSRRTAP